MARFGDAIWSESMIDPEERLWLSAVVADQADTLKKLIYADWLEERRDTRAPFLRAFVLASESMNPADFPDPAGLPEEWLELIGFRLLERAAAGGFPELKGPLLKLARPALRLNTRIAPDAKIAIGGSKIGGLPDLPPNFPWPPGGDCKAIYNDDTGGTERLAGFMGQVNFAEIAHTQAARDLPATGVLSFFCFQDIENDNPDAIGALAIYFPESTILIRTEPPGELTEGNGIISTESLTFQETLDLPSTSDGPWSAELLPEVDKDYSAVYDHFRSLNFDNFLGYGRATSGMDPTPTKETRHLITLKNGAGCLLHIQIDARDLAACNFGAIKLVWVDFD